MRAFGARAIFFGVVGGGDGGALSTSLLPLKCRREGLNALPVLANVPYSVLTRERHSGFSSLSEYVCVRLFPQELRTLTSSDCRLTGRPANSALCRRDATVSACGATYQFPPVYCCVYLELTYHRLRL